MGSINWSGFDWAAFSTLTTGALAVIGATIVGILQARISRRQADIADRQTQLQEFQQKIDLYERRFEVFEVASAFIVAAERQDLRIDSEAEAAFFRAVDKSRFLFAKAVTSALLKIGADANGLFFYRRKLDRIDDDNSRVIPYDGERETVVQEIIRLEEAIQGHSMTLPALFGHELQLGARGDATEIGPVAA